MRDGGRYLHWPERYTDYTAGFALSKVLFMTQPYLTGLLPLLLLRDALTDLETLLDTDLQQRYKSTNSL